MTQLKHEGSEWATTLGAAITLVREDDNYYTFEHGSLAAEISEIKFTARIKDTSEPGTGTAAIEITNDDQPTQWTTSTNYEATLYILTADTDGFRKASVNQLDLAYDIQIIHNDGKKYTVEKGTLTIEPDITHDDSTAAYPSRDTLSDLETEIANYAAGFDRTFLSGAAVASDTDIDVTSAAIFSAGDDIRVLLDDGTYTQVTIDVISTNNVNFATSDPGGIDSAAAAGNVVLKVV